jgi:hypothetical protein
MRDEGRGIRDQELDQRSGRNAADEDFETGNGILVIRFPHWPTTPAIKIIRAGAVAISNPLTL